MKKDFYVDYFLASVEIVEAAKTLKNEATGPLATTGCCYQTTSGSKKVLDGLDQEHLAPQRLIRQGMGYLNQGRIKRWRGPGQIKVQGS